MVGLSFCGFLLCFSFCTVLSRFAVRLCRNRDLRVPAAVRLFLGGRIFDYVSVFLPYDFPQTFQVIGVGMVAVKVDTGVELGIQDKFMPVAVGIVQIILISGRYRHFQEFEVQIDHVVETGAPAEITAVAAGIGEEGHVFGLFVIVALPFLLVDPVEFELVVYGLERTSQQEFKDGFACVLDRVRISFFFF